MLIVSTSKDKFKPKNIAKVVKVSKEVYILKTLTLSQVLLHKMP